MRATLQIKWLIVLLGCLCHSVYVNTATEPSPLTPANVTNTGGTDGDKTTTTTVTTVSATTAGATVSATTAGATVSATTAGESVTVTTSQNNIDKQSTAVQPTQTTPVPTQNTSTVNAVATGKGASPTASLTSRTNTTIETTTVIISSALAATPTSAPANTVATPSTRPLLNTQPSTVTPSPYSLSNKTSAPYNVSSQNEEQHKSTNSPTVAASKAPALTTVTVGQPLSRGGIKIPESTTVPGKAGATTQLANPGVSSTSSSTSSSVKKGVDTATTDSAMEATTATIKTPTSTQKFVYSHKGKVETKEKDDEKNLRKVCKRLMESMENGTCTLNWLVQNGSVKIESVEINGKVNESLAQQYYDELTQKEQIKTDNKTLIAILASCGALLIMIVILGVCASHHRKPYNENQQHLTEELHTVENGYHDNPTLEVMEVQPEMLEKKMVLNGEFNDSWMVPLDHLSKEDHPEEEDTHL